MCVSIFRERKCLLLHGDSDVTKRDDLIARLVQKGCPVTAVGRTFGISEARVRQIADEHGVTPCAAPHDSVVAIIAELKADRDRLQRELDEARATIKRVALSYHKICRHLYMAGEYEPNRVSKHGLLAAALLGQGKLTQAEIKRRTGYSNVSRLAEKLRQQGVEIDAPNGRRKLA